MDIAGRIRAKMADTGLNETQLGKRSGVPQPTINRILSGESASPRMPTIAKLARALKVSPEWLMYGIGDDTFDANVESAQGPTRYYEYPEISWVQAGVAAEAMDLFNVGDFEAMHPSDALAGPNGFWLKVRGPSMTSTNGMSFSEGMLILVSSTIEPRDGQYVVSRKGTNTTFRQLREDAGMRFLRALNPSYPSVDLADGWEIVGTVVSARYPESIFI